MKLLPQPQRIDKNNGRFAFKNIVIRMHGSNIDDRDLGRYRKSFEGSGFDVETAPTPDKANLVLERREGLAFPNEVRDDVLDQAYVLSVAPDQVSVAARGAAGISYGLQTLRQMLRQERELPCVRITDWPDMPFRGLHLTLGSGHMPAFEKMKQLIDTLASYKMNAFVMEYDDRFPFEKHPVLVHPSALSKDQIRELIAFGTERHVDVIPLLDSLGHAQAYLAHEEYRHLAEVPDQIAEMCASNPDTITFIKELWTEILEVHAGCRFAHITGDEVFRLGRFCPKCAKHAKDGTLSDLYCRYYGDLSRWILDHGPRPIMWADMVLQHSDKLPTLPRELVMNDWNYRGMERYAWTSTMLYNLGVIDRDTLDAVPEDLRVRYEPYWLHPSTAPDFTPFPHVRFLQDQGFDVIGASAASDHTGQFPITHFGDRVSNNKYFSRAVRDADALGLLNTYWSGSGSVIGAMHGVLAGAAYSWHFVDEPMEVFVETFQQLFLETGAGDLPAAAATLDGLKLSPSGYVDGSDTSLPGPFVENVSALTSGSPSDPVAGHYMDLLTANGKLAEFLNELNNTCRAIDRALIGGGDDVPLDIRAVMNLDLTAVTHKLGSGLSAMATGRQVTWGVPFDVIDPKQNNGHNMLGLFGQEAPDRPKRAAVDVDSRFTRIFFLHTSAYAEKGAATARHRFLFEDGDVSEQDIVVGEKASDWHKGRPFPTRDALYAWRGRPMDAGTEKFAYLAWWDNPRPDVPIKTIEFVSLESTGYYDLIAITGRRSAPNPLPGAEREKLSARLHAAVGKAEALRRQFTTVYSATMSEEDALRAVGNMILSQVGVLDELYRTRLGRLG